MPNKNEGNSDILSLVAIWHNEQQDSKNTHNT